ncbi:SRPBCC family protein [Ruegeria atlantica]|uniref:SRPBCC family protein n=1 Tax=Ruegeria atlantica TaxID=81569 RepID=UPI00147FFD50|nr:SRPBCC family protein [Ruegeria atlantica]
MDIKQEFRIELPAEKVWAALNDVQLVADCLPGAELGEAVSDTQFNGSLNAKLGPVATEFQGEVVIERRDEEWLGILQAKGLDRRSGTRVNASTTYQLQEDGAGTIVAIESKVALSGSLAQFARQGLIEDVARELTAEFSRVLEAKLSAATEEEADAIVATELKPVAIVLKGILSRISGPFKRLFGSKTS